MEQMDLHAFFNVAKIANDPAEYADSLILVYKDTCDVMGPYFGENAQFAAFDKASATGRPFMFKTWSHKG